MKELWVQSASSIFLRHRFFRIVIESTTIWNTDPRARYGNRKDREVLEPGGLNVERVRTLLRGDECLAPDDMDIRNACSDLMIGRSWVLREQHHCSWVQAPLLL